MADPTARRTLPSVDELLPFDDAAGCLALRHLPYPGQIGLRLGEPAAARIVAEVLGVDLPQAPNRSATGDDLTVLWLGPDEWLVLTKAGREQGVVEKLRRALAGHPAGVVDLSANRTAIDVAGPDARFLLATVSTLDFHPRAFLPGDCAQTIVVGADTIILRPGPQERFRLLVRPSFARHLVLCLLDTLVAGRPPRPATLEAR